MIRTARDSRTYLAHEIGDHAVEAAAFVAETLFASAQSTARPQQGQRVRGQELCEF